MRSTKLLIGCSLASMLAACTVGDEGEEDATGVLAATTGLVWPNTTSATNSDAWLRDHHAQVSALRPKVLVLIANNRNSLEFVKTKATGVAAAIREASRYHGYKNTAAKAQLDYQIVKYADMRDNSGKDWPAAWPVKADATGTLSFVYEGLFTESFSGHYGYVDPSSELPRYLTLCELFERGIINELWVSAPRYRGNALGVYETRARAQAYDAAGNLRPGVFTTDFDPGTVGKCKVTVRLSEIATDNETPDADGNRDRGVGCSVHSIGHNVEFMRNGIPEYKTNSARFFHFDLDSRYRLYMTNQYDACAYGASNCWYYPDNNTLARPDNAGEPGVKFAKWSEGCGNVHFPPNALSHYDYNGSSAVLSTCENYGIKEGRPAEIRSTYGGGPAKTIVDAFEKQFGDCGGGWQMYMWQNFPGYGNKATGDDGKPMKSWLPFMYY